MPGMLVMGIVLLTAIILLALNSGLSDTLPFLYLLPWLIALGAVLIAPLVYLHHKGRFRLYDPLVWAVCSYLFPAFVIGGLMLVFGWSAPEYLNLIQDPAFDLPYTIVLVMLGSVGFAIGYLVPIGEVLGRSIQRALPTWEFELSSYIVPSIVLFILGSANLSLGFIIGVIGYQRPESISTLGGLIFMTSSLLTLAVFLMIYVVLRRKKFDFLFFAVVVPLLLTSIAGTLLAGNRGALLHVFVVFGLAYVLAGLKVTVRRGFAAVVLLIVALFLGMLYGTTFRNIKGNEEQMSMDRYTENISSTFDNLSRGDLANNFSFGFTNLAVRIDSLSSVAVVVSNYEQLAPYEESYGLDNNIWRDLSTFFIPRFVWADKPPESDARRYSDLYFHYGENSFVFSPFGDLLRNFGPVGVPIGMFILGLIMRVIYRSLVENQPRITWRVALYFLLLTAVSYELMFAVIIPSLTKVAFIGVFGILILYVTARLLGYRRIAIPQ